ERRPEPRQEPQAAPKHVDLRAFGVDFDQVRAPRRLRDFVKAAATYRDALRPPALWAECPHQRRLVRVQEGVAPDPAERELMNGDIRHLVPRDRGLQTRPVLGHRFERVHTTAPAHAAAREKREESNVGTDVPERHAGFQEVRDRLLDRDFVRTGPVEFLRLWLDQETYPASRTGADHDPRRA